MTDTDLIKLDEESTLEAFMTPGGEIFKPHIEKVHEMVEAFDHDLSTETGRKRTASFAYRIAKLKTKMVKTGKELTAGWRAQTKMVNANCKFIETELDGLRDKARAPLNEWENKEAARIETIKCRMDAIDHIADDPDRITVTDLAWGMDLLKGIPVDFSFEEFEDEARARKEDAIERLEMRIAEREKQDIMEAKLEQARKDREELEALRREKAEREALDASGPESFEEAELEDDVPLADSSSIMSDNERHAMNREIGACGDDAKKWAAMFCKTIENMDKSEIDMGLMIGWFANAIEQAHDKRVRESILPSEALCGFAAWLATLPETLIIGAEHDDAPLPPLIAEYCKAQGLQDLRQDLFPGNLVKMSKLEDA